MGTCATHEDPYLLELRRLEVLTENLHARLVAFQPNDAPSRRELMNAARNLAKRIELILQTCSPSGPPSPTRTSQSLPKADHDGLVKTDTALKELVRALEEMESAPCLCYSQILKIYCMIKVEIIILLKELAFQPWKNLKLRSNRIARNSSLKF